MELSSTSQAQKKPSVFGGACIVTCVCIGAGMLGLPTAGAGGWFLWSSLALVFTMIIMTASGCLLLEAYKSFPFRSSFSTVTRELLGPKMSIFNNLAVYFVGAILLYAYTTSSGLIIEQYTHLNPSFASVVFVLLFSSLVWHSTRVVDRISVVLLLFMVFSFCFSISGLFSSIRPTYLTDNFEFSNGKYVFALMPIALASFGYHHTVSTLRDYYVDEFKAQKAIIFGTLISLIIYLTWQASVYGNLSRLGLSEVVSSGGNVDALMALLDRELGSKTISTLINAFSASAILSSFIGVGLGVFDFLADVFQFPNDRIGRFKTWSVTFIPPLLLSYFYPFGFLSSIAYASLFAAIWACIVPALLVRQVRLALPLTESQEDNLPKHHPSWNPSPYKVPGGDFLLIIVVLYGLLIIASCLLSTFQILPDIG